MGYDSTIENMEKALAKKKAQRAERNGARIAKLKERILAKNEKIQTLNDEVTALNTECADLISDQNVAGVENKTEPFSPGIDAKDSDAKDPVKKKQSSKK